MISVADRSGHHWFPQLGLPVKVDRRCHRRNSIAGNVVDGLPVAATTPTPALKSTFFGVNQLARCHGCPVAGTSGADEFQLLPADQFFIVVCAPTFQLDFRVRAFR